MSNVITVVSFCVGVGIVAYTIWNHDRIARFISCRKLGIIERDFRDLKEVIVVADHVEPPSGTLLQAVEDNFREGIKYLFLVSHSRADREVTGYFLIFKSLAQKAIAETSQDIEVDDLVVIKKLPFDWPDVPYIFYQHLSESGERLTTAFRGNQRCEGIADYYEELTTPRSLAIASALLSQAPEHIRTNINLVRFSYDKDLRNVANNN